MKFILWTVVWFGFQAIDRIVDVFWYGSPAGLDARYSREIQGEAAVLSIALWFICYFFIIKRERSL